MSRICVRVEERWVDVPRRLHESVSRRERHYVATCRTGQCPWESRPQVVKAAAEDEARWHREQHRREAAS